MACTVINVHLQGVVEEIPNKEATLKTVTDAVDVLTKKAPEGTEWGEAVAVDVPAIRHGIAALKERLTQLEAARKGEKVKALKDGLDEVVNWREATANVVEEKGSALTFGDPKKVSLRLALFNEVRSRLVASVPFIYT